MGESYKPRPYRTFSISDPKTRTISAAEFRDRVAHHALCAVLEPLFERTTIFDSYACRPGKGSHAAVKRAQYFSRRFKRFLKLDIQKFFENLDHEVLKTSLRRIVKDQRILDLTDRIINHGAPGSLPGKGLPIGNLTSQHFANYYMTSLDHFIKEKVRAPGVLRYMDDLLLFSDSRNFLRQAHRQIREFLEQRLKLNLKAKATIHAPVSEGIPFLGMRIWPQVIRLDNSGKRRLIGALRMGSEKLIDGDCMEDDLAASLRSRLGHTEHANAMGLRRSLSDIMDLGSEALRARTGSFGAVPGTTTPGTCAPPIATTTTLATATTMWGSALRAHGNSADSPSAEGANRPDALHLRMQGPRPGHDQSL